VRTRALLPLALLAGSAAALAAAGAIAAPPHTLTVVFRGTYALESRAQQQTFAPASATCIPGSRQHESERASWTIAFAGAFSGTAARVVLRRTHAHSAGTHVWDEHSFACAGHPAGRLVCRSRPVAAAEELVVDVSGRRWVFHPSLVLVAGGGCSGGVANEHPDCGARDRAAITDFGFLAGLRREAPRLRPPARTAAFDVRRTAACSLPGPRAQPGSRNPNDIHQRTVVRYRGTFTVPP
jgi:hypothetical protein